MRKLTSTEWSFLYNNGLGRTYDFLATDATSTDPYTIQQDEVAKMVQYWPESKRKMVYAQLYAGGYRIDGCDEYATQRAFKAEHT